MISVSHSLELMGSIQFLIFNLKCLAAILCSGAKKKEIAIKPS